MEPIDKIWTEKFRPKKVSEIVGDFKHKILKYLDNPAAIPHFLLYSKTPGTGKCLIGEELFLTDNGLISFEDYIVKNNIKEEKTNKVEKIFCPINGFSKTEYFYKGKSKTVKIKTKNGYTIEGTPEHKIKVFDLNEGFVWKKLIQINTNDIIPIFYNTNKFGNNNKFDYTEFEKFKKNNDNSSIIIKKPMEINNDIAYLLGVIVANGIFSGEGGVRISTFKPWLQEKLIKIYKENFNIDAKIRNYLGYNEGIDINRVWFSRFLINVCGFINETARNKKIPKKIFECSKDIQMNFIYGLLEDSWISKEGYIEYSTASKYLAKELNIMLLNLGFFTKHSEKYLEEYNHTYHNLTFSVEHSRKFLENFFMIYKNEKIEYKNNSNTNILSYGKIIEQYVKNCRIRNKINKKDVYEKNLVRLKYTKGSFERVKKCFYDLLKEEYLRDTINIFMKNNIFLDRIIDVNINIEEKNIYDFHIPNTHSFLTSGIISHNTTLAKAIINELKCDALILNSSDDRKIDVIREKVKQFAITQSSKQGMRRCVFLDEFDGMLKASQDALRNVMETYSGNVFFILTANNINKIIEPLQSRCVMIPFSYPKKEEIYLYLESICKSENLKYTKEGLTKLIDINYPSIRNCVLGLQDIKTEEKIVDVNSVQPVNEVFESLWQDLKNKEWKKIKEVVMATTVDPRELNKFFWEKTLEDKELNLRRLQVLCRNEKDISWGSDAKIIFCTSLIEMLK